MSSAGDDGRIQEEEERVEKLRFGKSNGRMWRIL